MGHVQLPLAWIVAPQLLPLPLGLAVYSFVEIGLEASTPLWVTLGIFSFNSFLTLHAPAPNVAAPKVHTTAEVCAEPPLPPPQQKRSRKPKTGQSKTHAV